MKHKIMIVLLIIVTTFGFIIGNTNTSQESESIASVSQTQANTSSVRVVANDGHQNLPLECKTCHACDFPTKRDPCLIMCPRGELITISHKPEEGPEYVVLNPKGVQYGDVVFSHLIHAQMADFSIGCDGCHHYNTAGPIAKCVQCHDESRNRKDITVPDLKGALHRQCYTCHRQWSHSNDCSYCHLPKNQDSPQITQEKVNRLIGRTHPEYAAQPRIVYETNYPDGRVVTFYHDEHVDLYNISCQTCHKNDNCMKCHDVDITYDKPRKRDLTGKSHEQVHQYCNACHSNHSCDKCHLNEVKDRFDHKITGFDLAPYHTKLSCDKCHKRTNPMDKPNPSCVSCHKDFEVGKFNHDKTGYRLDVIHADLDCETCHTNHKYNVKPSCGFCHDNYTYPRHQPGRVLRR